jgi:hypothetical protein
MKRFLLILGSSLLVMLGSQVNAQFGVKLEAYGTIIPNLTYTASLQPGLSLFGAPDNKTFVGLTASVRLELLAQTAPNENVAFQLVLSPQLLLVLNNYLANYSFGAATLEGIARVRLGNHDGSLGYFDIFVVFSPSVLLEFFDPVVVRLTPGVRLGFGYTGETVQFGLDFGAKSSSKGTFLFSTGSVTFTVFPGIRLGFGIAYFGVLTAGSIG